MSFFNGETDLSAGNVYNNLIEVNAINESTGGVGVTIEGVLAQDSYVQLSDIAAPANPANGQGKLYKLTGNAGLWWLPDSAGSPVNLASAGTSVTRVGATVNNTLPRWDGNSTDTIQGSGISVDNSNNMSGVASLTLESGSFDTTITVATQTIAAPSVNIPNLAGTSGDFLISNASQNVLNKSVTNSTWSGGTVLGLTGLSVNDNGSNNLALASASGLTAGRTLSVNVNDANRTLSLAGNATFGGVVSLANNFTTVGANPLTFTTTGTTSLTLPTSGTLVTTTASQTLTNKTLDTPVITNATLSINDTASSPLNTLSIVSTSAPILTAPRTLTIDVSNADRTIDLNGNLSLAADFTTSGGNALTFTTTGPTSITLPTSGTLVTAPVSLTTQVTGTLPIGNGGTAIASTPANGNLLIGNGTGYTLATLTGTSNQTTISNGAGTITIGTAQNIGTSSTPTFASETLSAANNQLTLGSGTTTTISATAPAASATYTVPDVGTSASFVMTQGNQTINGNKTFNNTTTMSGLTSLATQISSNTVTYATGTIGTGGAASLIITGTGTSWTSVMIGGIIVSGATTAVVTAVNSATQIAIADPITLANGSSYTLYYGSDQSAGGSEGEVNTVDTGGSWAIYTSTLGGLNYSTGTVTAAAGSVTGSGTTFTRAMVGGIIHFATGASVTSYITDWVSATSLTISPTQTIGSATNYIIYYGGSQTMGGLQTVQNLYVQAATNQITLGGSASNFTTTLTAPAPAASRTYTIQDAGAAANIVTLTSPYVVGDIPFASSTTQMSRLADVATGNALISGGVGVAPSWGKIALSGTSAVTGTLPIGNGGTNSATALSGSSIMVSNGTSVVQGAAGTTTTVLHGNAGGTPTYSAVSLTADVTGVLPLANGGTGGSTAVTSVTGTANQITASPTTGAVGLSIPTTFVAPGTLQDTNGMLYSSASIAATGTTQGTTTTTITKSYNVITTSTAGSAQACILPTGTAGMQITIVNRGSGNCPVTVFPAVGGTINGLATNTGIAIPIAGQIKLIPINGTQWYTTKPNDVAETNITLGNNTGTNISTGTSNVTIGAASGLSITTGTSNIAIGNTAMGTSGNAVSGADNIAIGRLAGTALATTGNLNVIVGAAAGTNMSTAASNVVMGPSAGTAVTTGTFNIAIGSSAMGGAGAMISQDNIAIGRLAGNALATTAVDNVFVGRQAGQSMTSNNNNVAIGSFALATSTSASNNIAVGANAMGNGNVSGNGNVAVGVNTGLAMTSGNSNVLIGLNAGTALTTGASNVFIGNATGDVVTAASNAIGIGQDVMGNSNLSGADNIGIGRSLGMALTTGARNILLGVGNTTGGISTGSDNIAIGQNAGGVSTGINAVTGSNNISMGAGTGLALMAGAAGNISIGQNVANGGAGNTATNNIGIGTGAMTAITTGGNNVVVGAGSFTANQTGTGHIVIGQGSGTAMNSGSNSIVIGQAAGLGIAIGSSNIAIGDRAIGGAGGLSSGTGNIAIGTQAGNLLNTSAANNVLIGTNAGDAITTGSGTVAIGLHAAGVLSTATGVTAIGTSAAANATGNNITIIGNGAGANISTSTGTIAIGQSSLGNNANTLTGADNVVIGRNAANNLTGASAQNVIIGATAFAANTTTNSNSNVVIGFGAASTGTLATSNNVIIGLNAGRNLTSGTQNVLIGVQAGSVLATTGSSTLIGYQAGLNTTGAQNTVVGYQAARQITSGTQNTIVGYAAAGGNGGAMTGSANTIIGYNMFNSNTITSAANNTMVGQNAGNSITTGTGNTTLGSAAGTAMSGASSNNVAVGVSALGGAGTLTGGDNIAIGRSAGVALTGAAANNILIGSIAGDNITTGAGNTVVGFGALGAAGTTTTDNIAIGRNAMGTGVASGTGSNIAVGVGAGVAITTGTGNLLLGTGAGNAITTGSNSIVLGTPTAAAASAGAIRIGTSAGDLITGNLTTASQHWSPTTTNQADLGTFTNRWRTEYVNGIISGSSSTYAVNTASQTTTTITGLATAFTTGMQGGVIVFANGVWATLVTFVSATSFTVTPSQTVASQAYTIYYNGFQMSSNYIAARALYLPTPAGGVMNPLTPYLVNNVVASVTFTVSAGTGKTLSLTSSFCRLGRMVIYQFFSATSAGTNSLTFANYSGSIFAGTEPQSSFKAPVYLQASSGTLQWGYIQFTAASATVRLVRDYAGTAWGTAGNDIFQDFTASYLTA